MYMLGGSMTDRYRTYLGLLPDGIDSYPHCQTKNSAMRILTNRLSALEDKSFLDDLPPQVRALIEAPPEYSAWVPSVHYVLLLAAYLDHETELELKMGEWYYSDQLSLLANKIYAPLFKVMNPEIILRGAKSRFSNFHTSVDVSVERWAKEQFSIRLDFPNHLLPDWRLELIGEGIRAALDVGGHESAVQLKDCDAGSARFSALWGASTHANQTVAAGL